MRNIFLLLFIFGAYGFLKSQGLTLKINNKTGYPIDKITLPNEHSIALLESNNSIVIEHLKEIIIIKRNGFPLNIGHGQIPYKKRNSLNDTFGPFGGDDQVDTLRNAEVEYDLLISENEYGYTLYYKFICIIHNPVIGQIPKKGPITNKYKGEFYPVNKEGDNLAAICKEGYLQINEDNTFNYILTPDKEWCPEIKNTTYEGSCEVKDDTLYLYNKGFKTPSEPRFSIADVDTGNTILISLFNDTNEPINIEKVHSINSAQSSVNVNPINMPFKNNVIEIKDKRILGIAIYPVDHPEVQIVLKKIRASAKINVILATKYYDSVFNGRKFIYQNNVLTEVNGTGKFTDQYIKN